MSLNACPLTQYSEELALEDAMRGLEIRRVWDEQELVRFSGGQMFPGTPDGMFEEHSGALTCVQVVRVPVSAHMSLQQVDNTIYDTVLTKVVKSQQWMKATRILPHNFLIFCWLPPLQDGLYPTIVGSRTEALLERMRDQGWPFYWTVKTPTDPGSLFPSAFAFHSLARGVAPRARKKAISEADLSTFCLTDFEDDDDPFECDIFAIPESDENLSTSDTKDFQSDEGDDDSLEHDELAGDVDCDDDLDDSCEYDIFAIPEVNDELADECVNNPEQGLDFSALGFRDFEKDFSEKDRDEDDFCDCDMFEHPEVNDERAEGQVDPVAENWHSQGIWEL